MAISTIRLVSCRLLGLSLLALTLGNGGCRSEKAAFAFVPATTAATGIAGPTPDTKPALPTQAPSAVAAAAAPVAELPRRARPASRPLRRPLHQLRAAATARRPGAVVPQASSASGHPTERTLLWAGVGSVALGLLLTYIGGNAVPASAGLLSFAHVLLVLGGLLMAAWFVLLLLRASKE